MDAASQKAPGFPRAPSCTLVTLSSSSASQNVAESVSVMIWSVLIEIYIRISGN